MTIGHQDELCELCRLSVQRAGRLCASCSEMIVRLSRIAAEATTQSPSPPIKGLDRPMQPDRPAQLFERALRINIFNIGDYRRQP
jgi:hypothetical protein